MGLNILALIAAKKYIKETVLGGGAVVGKNVTVSSVEPIEGGNEVTFSYTLDSGQKKYSTLQVMNGKNGFSPIITTKTSNNGADFRLEIQDVNGTTVSPNLIPTVPKVDTSNFITDIDILDNILLVTKGDGSVKQIQLPTVAIETESEKKIEITTMNINNSKEVEIVYDGEVVESFPNIHVDYSTGDISVMNNGNNDVVFNLNDDKELEVHY